MFNKNKNKNNSSNTYNSPIDDAVATSMLRNAYTRERVVILMRAIMALGGCLAVCILGLVLLAMRPIEYKYFATGCDGRIMKLIPLDQPMGSLSELTTWVTNSVTSTFTFDFVNYRGSFERARENYTTQGWEVFEQALKESKILDSVISNQYIATAVPQAAPVLLKEGDASDGRHAWKFQFPMIITYQAAKNVATQNIMVTVTVVREDMSVNPRGLGISQLTMQ